MASFPFVIASDLDGTLADHTRMKIDLAKKLGYALAPEETASEVMPTKMPAEDYRRITSVIYGKGSLHASVMPCAKETVERLTKAFGPLFIISRRGRGIEAAYGMQWLQEHLIPPLHERNIFFVQDDAEKQAVMHTIGASVYIDDKQEVLDQMPEIIHRILFDPYDVFTGSPYPRIRSWEDLPSCVGNLVGVTYNRLDRKYPLR